jgi:hypothetical protein
MAHDSDALRSRENQTPLERNRLPASPAQPEQPQFTLLCRNRFVCEVRDRRNSGVEAQFFKDGTLVTSQRFETRELALEWAMVESDAIAAAEGQAPTTTH